MYIEKSASSEFKKLLADGIKALKQGMPSKSDTDVGPQADSLQTTNITRFLDIGRKEGKALAGGEPAKSIGANFIQPTIFTDLKDTSDVNQLEVFGPVAVLHEFDSEEEAIARANDSECKPSCSPLLAISNANSESTRWSVCISFQHQYRQGVESREGFGGGNGCCERRFSLRRLRTTLWWVQGFWYRTTEGIQGSSSLDTREDSVCPA